MTSVTGRCSVGVFMVLLLGIPVGAAAQVSAGDRVDLVRKWVAATRQLADAQSAMAAPPNADSPNVNTAIRGQMTANRQALVRIDAAGALLPSAAQYPTGSPEREVLDAYRNILTSLRDALNEQHAIDTEMTSLEGLAFIQASGGLMERIFKVRGDLAEIWGRLAPATEMLAKTMVDTERLTDGRVQHLRITASERADLLRVITSAFPAVKTRVTDEPSESVGAIAKFTAVLTGALRSADAAEWTP